MTPNRRATRRRGRRTRSLLLLGPSRSTPSSSSRGRRKKRARGRGIGRPKARERRRAGIRRGERRMVMRMKTRRWRWTRMTRISKVSRDRQARVYVDRCSRPITLLRPRRVIAEAPKPNAPNVPTVLLASNLPQETTQEALSNLFEQSVTILALPL